MNKRVLVTGSSRGIGLAIAKRLKNDGFEVITHSTKSVETMLHFDVSNRDEVKSAIEEDIDKNGPYYGIVHNAGICRDNNFVSMTDSEWDSVINTDLTGFYNVIKPCVFPMISNRCGRIIAISSVSGVIGNKGQVNYSAAKAGLIGSVKSLALELAKRNITVNAVAPGIIETDMTSSIAKEIKDEMLKTIPMKRFGNVDDIASIVSFLMSESAGYITRQVINVNGGMI